MKVSCKWIEWAHTPGAEDGQPLAERLVELAEQANGKAVDIEDPELIAEIVSVAELYRCPVRGDALYDMGPWWRSQPEMVITEGRAALRALKSHAHA